MKNLNGFMVPITCHDEVLPLAKKNGHKRDGSVTMDEEPHIYYVEGETGYTSVTTVAHELFEKFDSIEVATKMIGRGDFRTAERYAKYQRLAEEAKTSGQLVEMIVESWDAYGKSQAALGTAMHRYIELHANGLPSEDDVKIESCPERQYYHEYTKKIKGLGLEPYRTEWMLWDKDLKVTGSIDMIYHNPKTNTFHMVDWKRSKAIQKFGFKKGTGLCSHLPDCNFIHYSLQLNIYKYLLEKNYGLTIHDMTIVVFHPSNDTYLEFEIADMQDLVHELLTSRVV